jgi:hypothetical protein
MSHLLRRLSVGPSLGVSLGLGALPLLATLLAPVPAEAANPHYLRLLRQGTFALERNDDVTAAHDLRLACFGLLDEPPQLAQCLTRLGLAQAGNDDDEGFRETFRRIVEIEERFGAYHAADLDPATRQAFEAQVAKRVPAKILETTPSFQHLVPREETPAPAGGAEATAKAAPAAAAGGGQGAAPAPVPASGESPPTKAAGEAPKPRVELTSDQAAQLARARELLKASQHRSDLMEPLAIARDVADARPDVADAQSLTAVIAYRASMWKDAVTYFRHAGSSIDENPEMLFYLAVSLYESGDRTAAADALRKSLPQIEKTPFVLSYRDKILGPAAPSGNDGKP